jgi:hypothetical protein
MQYTVKYRAPHRLLWKKIVVKADGIIPETQSRWFILPDETRVEVPATAEFVFSKERFSSILAAKEAEIGQPIPIKREQV